MTSTYLDQVRARLNAQEKVELAAQEHNARQRYIDCDNSRMEIPFFLPFAKWGAGLGAIAASFAGPAFWIDQYVFPDHLVLGAFYGAILGALAWLALRIYIHFDDERIDWDLGVIESSDISAQHDIHARYEQEYDQTAARYRSCSEQFCTQSTVRSVAAHLAANFEKKVRVAGRESHILMIQVPFVLLVQRDRIEVVKQKPASGKTPAVLETLELSACGIPVLQDEVEQAALARALGLMIRLDMCRRLPVDPGSPTGQPTEVTMETGGADVTLCYKAINGAHLSDTL